VRTTSGRIGKTTANVITESHIATPRIINASNMPITFHIPDQAEQMIRYYGFYSNVSRKLRQKENQNGVLPLPSIEIFFKPPHLLVGWTVKFFL
jgi:hypothetical protein